MIPKLTFMKRGDKVICVSTKFNSYYTSGLRVYKELEEFIEIISIVER